METTKKPLLFSEIVENQDSAILTTNKKFNEWFSRYAPDAVKPKFGGMIKKSAVFVTGTSGAGKTTTMFNIMQWTPDVVSSFYARECDLDEIKEQLSPFQVTHHNAHFCDANTHPTFNDYMEHLRKDHPEIVIVDSLQAIAKTEHHKMQMGEDEAAEYIRQELTNYIKENRGVLFLIGHNTKEGEFAGKNTNMQMVDAHMVLEFDKKTGVRKIYWGQKNRKGPMTSMYYEINDGAIQFFNEDEYTPEVTTETLNVKVPALLTPKEMLKLFVSQFKNHPLYQEFKNEVDVDVKLFLKNNKSTYGNEFWEAHAYMDAYKRAHDIAVVKGMINLK